MNDYPLTPQNNSKSRNPFSFSLQTPSTNEHSIMKNQNQLSINKFDNSTSLSKFSNQNRQLTRSESKFSFRTNSAHATPQSIYVKNFQMSPTPKNELIPKE